VSIVSGHRGSFATVLVGPCSLLREGLTRILSAAEFTVVASASAVGELGSTALSGNRPILLIMDVSNDQDAAVGQIRLFKGQHPTARIALLHNHNRMSDSGVVEAFRAGADAYFTMPNCDTFIKSLELVMLGETILPPAILSFILRNHNKAAADYTTKNGSTVVEAASKYTPRLSVRERCILHCLIAGDSNKMIARKNDIAEATVKVHVKAILRKIRVNNRTQAAIWAIGHNSSIGGASGVRSSLDPIAAQPPRDMVLALSEARTAGGEILLGASKHLGGPNGVDHADLSRGGA